MSPSLWPAISPLPVGTQLLHVGLAKTGTTALQNAASGRRAALLRHGVRYPGRRYNHRQAAFALHRRGSRQAQPRPDAWDELQAEIAADPVRRVLISNEFIAEQDEDTAVRFLSELGRSTHVVITLRSFGALLPSIWQQYVKTGYTVGFEDFLSIVLDRPVRARVPPPAHVDRHDQGAVVERWVRAAGPERVTVIVGDKARPRLISEAFEVLLDLPAGLLHDPAQSGSGSNRSLSAQEAAMLLAVNRVLAAYPVEEADLVRILRRGATARFLDQCPAPGPADALALPPWAAAAAAARGQEFAAVIADSGVSVIGDLEDLGRVSRSQPGRWTDSDTVSVDVAAQALVGALSAGIGSGPNFDRRLGARPGQLPTSARRAVRTVRKLPTRLKSQLRRRIERSGQP